MEVILFQLEMVLVSGKKQGERLRYVNKSHSVFFTVFFLKILFIHLGRERARAGGVLSRGWGGGWQPVLRR